MSMRRLMIGFAVSMVLGGCHGNPFRAVGENCHKPQVYQRAASVAPLKVPQGADAPNVAGALVIPSVDAAPPPPGPADPCPDGARAMSRYSERRLELNGVEIALYEVGHGDLLVMGGSCQRTWEHSVPKTSAPAGPRVSIQFRPRDVR